MTLLVWFSSLSGYAQLFSEKAEELNIDHYMSDPNAMGGGVAIFDFNNDGYDDIYLTGGLKNDQLYENLGDGAFREVTKQMGVVQFRSIKTMGVVAGDIDNDGFTDLFITTAENSRCYLLKNINGQFFEDISLASGINQQAWSMSAAMADYDLDGDLDIYVGNYVDFSDLPFDQNITRPLPDFFYQNNGNGVFSLINNPLTIDNEGCTLVTAFSDIDQDGDSDLLVLNDFGDFYVPNKLLLNNWPSLDYSDISGTSGLNSAINSMGVAIGDYNEDGNLDYYVTNIGHNILYENNGNAEFIDTARDLNVSDGTGVCWGTAFLDVNNDGHLDLYASKGSILNLNDSQENLLYLGSGPQRQFQNASQSLITDSPNKARGMAYGDLNNDGLLDIIAVNIRVGQGNLGKTKVYMNTGTNGNFVRIHLEGTVNNRNGYGAIVKAYSNGSSQIREVSGGSSYLSTNSSDIHIGFGSSEKIDSLVVHWPREKKKEVFNDLEVNKTYYIREGGAIYERITETLFICEGESISLNGENTSEEGVYSEVVFNEEESTNILKITKVVIKDPDNSDCVAPPIPSEKILLDGQMIVYPNPFIDTIQIQHDITFSDQIMVMLTDISGTIVRRELFIVKNTEGHIRISGYQALPPGLYILTIVNNGKTFSYKLLKT
jgi:hypothetical protein